MDEPIKMSLGTLTQVGLRKHVVDGDAHWRNLANTTEPSMCGGDVAFLSNYFNHLLNYCDSRQHRTILLSGRKKVTLYFYL